MQRDDLLTQIRIRARLHGRNHAGRVVQAVMHAMRKILPEAAYHGLAVQLPVDVSATTPRRHVGHRPSTATSAAHRLIRDVADELHVSGPDAAFYTRVTFEQLNAFCRGVTPAQLAESLPADLRPLLSARADFRTHRHRLVRMFGPAGSPRHGALRARLQGAEPQRTHGEAAADGGGKAFQRGDHTAG